MDADGSETVSLDLDVFDMRDDTTAGPERQRKEEVVAEKGYGKKRKRNVEKWAKNVRKLARNSGGGYISTSGKEVRCRQLKRGTCSCPKQCSSLVDEEQQLQIFQEFWNLKDYNLQNSWLVQAVTQQNVKRRRERIRGNENETGHVKKKPKNTTRLYRLPCRNGNEVLVCKVFFLRTLDISNGRLNRVLQYARSTGVARPDTRGKRPPANNTSMESVEQVTQFIGSLPAYQSLYTSIKNPCQSLFIPGMQNRKLDDLHINCKERDINPVLHNREEAGDEESHIVSKTRQEFKANENQAVNLETTAVEVLKTNCYREELLFNMVQHQEDDPGLKDSKSGLVCVSSSPCEIPVIFLPAKLENLMGKLDAVASEMRTSHEFLEAALQFHRKSFDRFQNAKQNLSLWANKIAELLTVFHDVTEIDHATRDLIFRLMADFEKVMGPLRDIEKKLCELSALQCTMWKTNDAQTVLSANYEKICDIFQMMINQQTIKSEDGVQEDASILERDVQEIAPFLAGSTVDDIKIKDSDGQI